MKYMRKRRISKKMKQMEKNKKIKNINGITLIALVITIIVLLILAGVSIATLMGQEGIIIQADTSRTETKQAQEKELIELSYSSAKIKKVKNMNIDNFNVTAEELQTELDSQNANAKVSDENKEQGTLRVEYKDSGNVYIVDQNGKIEKTNNARFRRRKTTNRGRKATNRRWRRNWKCIWQSRVR